MIVKIQNYHGFRSIYPLEKFEKSGFIHLITTHTYADKPIDYRKKQNQ